MSTLKRFQQWGDTHHPKWLDIIRIVLGLFLIFKGINFLRHQAELQDLLKNKMEFAGFFVLMIGHYITFAHLLGGILITIGVLTRFACLIQIPVLIGALFFINNSPGMMSPYLNELMLTILVLLLLIYFLIAGNGPLTFSFLEEDERNQ